MWHVRFIAILAIQFRCRFFSPSFDRREEVIPAPERVASATLVTDEMSSRILSRTVSPPVCTRLIAIPRQTHSPSLLSNPHHSDAMLVQSRGRIFPQPPSLSGSASSVGAASAAGAAPAPQPTLKARNLPVGNVKRGANYRSWGAPLGH